MEEDVEEREIARAKFNRYIDKAKLKCKSHNYTDALKYYKKAAKISSSTKLASKIAKLEKFLEELESSDEDESTLAENYEHFDGFKIYQAVWEKLYPHQQIGVKWFWGLHKKDKGGILGDDMGLGKTIQVIAFLSGLFDAGCIKHVIIVMPKSLMPNWAKEFQKWAPGIHLADYHGAKGKREKALEKVQQNGGVILTTYGMIVSSCEQLTEFRDRRFIWDYLILDEGHKIKNANKTSKSVRCIGAKYHFVLTGTPIQNNLSELWSLVDFVTEGKLLGTLKTFKTEFENPIVRARERDASQYEKRMGNEISYTLRKMLENIFLRRTKGEVFGTDNKENDNPDGNEEVPSENDTAQPDLKIDVQLSKKSDLIIWLYLSDIQLKIYKDFLEMDSIREAMVSTKSPLAHLTMLKKIADHPRLLSSAVCATLGLSEDTSESETVLLEESSKLRFTLKIVQNLKEDGHRVLIFSQSRKMLDIVDKILAKRGIKLLRFDGRIIDPVERQNLIKKFENDQSYTCFLLTTQVGAVGLNLTAADRVIIFDPSWNPGNDAQAVDRAYRIGQQKDVIIYRLITCGSIEEKIYRKQLFKQSISKQTTGSSKNPLRYFAKNQLQELFILEDPTVSITHGILVERHGQVMAEGALETHLSFLKSLDIFGVSDHGLVYSKEAQVTKEADDATYDVQIQERAKRAKELVTSEVNLCERIAEMSLIDPKSTQKIKKNKVPSTADISTRVIIPDSPTSDFVSISSPGESHESAIVKSPYPGKEYHSENLDDEVITINDSLEEDPAKVMTILPIKDSPKESPIESPKTENSMTTDAVPKPQNPRHQESPRRASDPTTLVPKHLYFPDIAETQRFGEIDPAILKSPVCIENDEKVLPAFALGAERFEGNQFNDADREMVTDGESNVPEVTEFQDQDLSNGVFPVPQPWVKSQDDSLQVSHENIDDSPIVSHEICDDSLQVSHESIADSPTVSRAVYHDSPADANSFVASSILGQGTMSESCDVVEDSCDNHVINQDQSFKTVYCSDSEENEIQKVGEQNSINIPNIDDSIKNLSLCSEEAVPPSHTSSDASFAEVVDYNGSPINITPVKAKRYSNTPRSIKSNGGFSISHTNTPSPKIASTHKDLRRSAAENVMQQRLSHGGFIPEVNHSSGSPFPGINHSLSSPSQKSTSARKDLRRSAVGLIYGLTPTRDKSDASSDSVEVINMACSPIDFQETVHDDQVVLGIANGKEVNEAPMWNLASASPDTFQSFEAARRSLEVGSHSNESKKDTFPSPQVRFPKSVSSSTPHLDTSDRSNERKSLQLSALTNLHAAEQSHASQGSSQYAGSESLFSDSPHTMENRCNSENASENQLGGTNLSHLREGSLPVQTSLQNDESESLSSDHVSSNALVNSDSHCSRTEPVSGGESFESELISEVAEMHLQRAAARLETSRRSSQLGEARLGKKSENVSIPDESAETDTNRMNIPNQDSYRSLHITESDSDHSADWNDQAIDESDPEIKLKESVRITQDQHESLQSVNRDDTYDSDAESISSNEMNMISMLSGGHLSTADYDHQSSDNHDSNDYVAVASNMIGDDSSDSDDSASDDDNDEILIRSRRSLRMSIFNKPKSSPVSTDVIDLSENSSESELLCRSGIEAQHSIESMQNTQEQSFHSQQEAETQSMRDFHPQQEVETHIARDFHPELEVGTQIMRDFHPEQEAETLIMAETDPLPVNYVWDMPFYRRTPGKEAKKNCFEEYEDVKAVEDSAPSPERNFKCPCGKHSSQSVSNCECMLDAEEQLEYRGLVKEARKFTNEGDHTNALSSYLKALKLANHDPRMKIAVMTLVKKLKQDFNQ